MQVIRVGMSWSVMIAVVMSMGCGSEADPDVPQAHIAGPATEGQQPDTDEPAATAVQLEADEVNEDSPAKPSEDLFPEVLVVTSLGDLRIRLNGEKAPGTVENFLVQYVDRRFYDETLVHYVDADFMMACGGYSKDYQPKETRTAIRYEGDNGLKNVKGSIAMVRHAEYIHSAKSEFFINLGDNPSLDYQQVEAGDAESRDPATYGYCVFGEVVEGLDILEKIGGVQVSDKEDFPRTPTTPVVIHRIQRLP